MKWKLFTTLSEMNKFPIQKEYFAFPLQEEMKRNLKCESKSTYAKEAIILHNN